MDQSNNLKEVWIKEFEFHTTKLAKCYCHIMFLASCLSNYVIPKGLTVKFPMSGLPSYMHNTINEMSFQTSNTLTKTVHDLYAKRANFHYDEVVKYQQRIMYYYPEMSININSIILNTQIFVQRKSQAHFKKFQSLLSNQTNHSQYHNGSNNVQQFPMPYYPSNWESVPNNHNIYPVNPNDYNLPTQNLLSLLEDENLLLPPPSPPQPLVNTSNPLTKSHSPNLHFQTDSFIIPQIERETTKSNPNSSQENIDTLKISKDIASKENYINLSNYSLKENEIALIQKGLNFAPTPIFDHIQLVSDTLIFARNLRKYFTKKTMNVDGNSRPNLTNPAKDQTLSKFYHTFGIDESDQEPLAADHPVEQFINTILSYVSNPNFSEDLNRRKNLSHNEFKAISSLKNNDNIIILPADKGDVTVIMNKCDYVDETMKQLKNSETYERLNKDKTIEINKQIEKFIKQNSKQEDLPNHLIELLINKSPKTPVFYTLPKVHKNVSPPPGRPIVASISSPTERISAYVDAYLQPFVKEMPSYIKNSEHFIDELKNIAQPLHDDIQLVSIDVESLYTNIKHEQGMKAVEEILNERPRNTKPSTKFMMGLINFILTCNCFRFKDEYYLQKKGTAMGTRMAPSYANIFMAKYEYEFLNTQVDKPLCWFRFIDDIFMIWTHGSEKLNRFLNSLNEFGNLNFTWQISSNSTTFLDVDVFVHNGFLKHKINIKPTNKFQYLHYQSCHPLYVKKSIPKSQLFRAIKLCSESEHKEEYITKMKNAFQQRGYPIKLLDEKLDEKNIRTHQKRINYTTDEPKLITQYYPGLHKLNNVIRIAFNILKNSPLTQSLFSSPPRVIFRRPPILKEILSHPKLPDDEEVNRKPGSHPCQKPRCLVCKQIENSATFKSSSTSKNYKIQGCLSCESKNIIYQIQCKKCPKDYIGSTTNTLRVRMTGHRFDYRHKDMTKPLVLHGLDHKSSFEETYKVKPIRQLNKNFSVPSLRCLEQAHQIITHSKTPHGLNIR